MSGLHHGSSDPRHRADSAAATVTRTNEPKRLLLQLHTSSDKTGQKRLFIAAVQPHVGVIIKCPGNQLMEEAAFPRRISPLLSFPFFFEDVYRFPGSGSVMDSNAAKEMIHSCPITTYEAPINSRSPGLRGSPGWC